MDHPQTPGRLPTASPAAFPPSRLWQHPRTAVDGIFEIAATPDLDSPLERRARGKPGPVRVARTHGAQHHHRRTTKKIQQEDTTVLTPLASVSALGLIAAVIIFRGRVVTQPTTSAYGVVRARAGFFLGGMVGLVIDSAPGSGLWLTYLGHAEATAGAVGVSQWHRSVLDTEQQSRPA